MIDEEQDLLETEDTTENLPGEEISPDDAELPEDDFETVSLTGTQKLWIAAATLASFFLFTVYLMPYDLILRYFIAQYAGPVRIDFLKFEPGLIGPHMIEELKVQVPNGTFIEAETVESGLATRDLLSNRARGTIRAEELDLSTAMVAGQIGEADLALDLRNIGGGLAQMQGSMALKTGFIKLSKLPETLPLPITAEDIRIKQLNLRMRANRGNLNFDGSSLQSNLFNVTLRGGGRTAGGLASLNLNARVCIKPDSRLEETNPDIFGYFTLLGGSGAAGGEKCLDLTGSLAAPRMQPVQ